MANPKFSLILNNRVTEITRITSRKVYSELIRDMVKEPTAIETWLNLFPFLEHIESKPVFTLIYKITKEPYIQSFQYKVLNRIINWRYNLYKWKIASSKTCNYCIQTDTIEHHFHYCSDSNNFWKEVSIWLYNITNMKFNFTICEIIFGFFRTSFIDECVQFVFNYIILLGKWYINKQRSNNQRIAFPNFICIVKEKLEILRMSYILHENLEAFDNFFGNLYNYLD